MDVQLDYRAPLAAGPLLAFFAMRAVPGTEEVDAGTYRRTVALPGGPGVLALTPDDATIACRLDLADEADVDAAVALCRRLFDLDADPHRIDAALGADPVLGAGVAACPGRRLPGAVDPLEMAVRAVVGQQVSVAAARTVTARLVARFGEPLPAPSGLLTHLFPTAPALAAATREDFPMPSSRARTVIGLCAAVVSGAVRFDRDVPRVELERSLLALPGIGPWTVDYIALRARSDPDVFLPSDLGVRRALERLGLPADPASAALMAEAWRPWRSYALLHLWASLGAV